MAGKLKKAVPGGAKKKFVVSKKKGAAKSKPTGMKKAGVVPGKRKRPEDEKEKEVVEPVADLNELNDGPVVLTDSKIIPIVKDRKEPEEVDDRPPTLHAEPAPRSLSDVISDDADVEFLSDQVYAYHELSSVVDSGVWEPESIIDLMDVFIRAINFGVVTISLLDKEKGTFGPFTSRGNYYFPGDDVLGYLDTAVVGSVIDWEALLECISAKKTPFDKWVREEGFECMGVVPIHDGHTILGFIFTATREVYQPSDIASLLLELIGGRLGHSITSNAVYK